MDKSEFIKKRAPLVTIIGTLSGLVAFNILFQLSLTFYPEAAKNGPYLLAIVVRHIFESLWLFSYLLRAIYLVIASYMNKKNSSDTRHLFSSARSSARTSAVTRSTPVTHFSRFDQFMMNLLLRFLWAKKVDGKFILGNSLYSIRRLCKILGLFVVIQIMAAVLGVCTSKNNFLSNPNQTQYEVQYKDYEWVLVAVYVWCLSSNALLLFLIRKGILSPLFLRTVWWVALDNYHIRFEIICAQLAFLIPGVIYLIVIISDLDLELIDLDLIFAISFVVSHLIR